MIPFEAIYKKYDVNFLMVYDCSEKIIFIDEKIMQKNPKHKKIKNLRLEVPE